MAAGSPSIYFPRELTADEDLDEFAEVALAIFVALTLLIWLLTYLERTLVKSAGEKRTRRVIRRRRPAPHDSD
jgi:hypothetical protein